MVNLPVSLRKFEPLPVLHAGGLPLANGPDRLGFLAQSDPSEPLAALRRRYEDNGYLWLKNFLPRDEVINFRGHFFAHFLDTGVVAAGTDPRDGLYSGNSG